MRSAIMLSVATGGLLATETLAGADWWANATALAVLCFVVVHIVTKTVPSFVSMVTELETKHAERLEKRDQLLEDCEKRHAESLDKRDAVLRELVEAIYSALAQKKPGTPKQPEN